MEDESVLSDNIEVLVYGDLSQELIQQVILNKPYSKSFARKYYEGIQNLKDIKNQDFQLKEQDIKIKYSENIKKLIGIAQTTQKSTAEYQDLENNNNFQWGNFHRYSQIISTKSFLLTVNFNIVDEFFLDPYINNAVSANISLLILTVDSSNKQSCQKILKVAKLLASNKSSSNLKYQSQMLLLNSGFYQTFNENIVLALCELPDIEKIGPCYIVGLKGKQDQAIKKFQEENSDKSIYVSFEGNMTREDISNLYIWLVNANQNLKYSCQLQDKEIKEIKNAIINSIDK